MPFRIGDKVVYPSLGPCLIAAMVEKKIAGESASFYTLTSLDHTGDVVLVPMQKLDALNIRRLLARSEIPKVLGRLEHASLVPKNWKQRAIDNAKLLASGAAGDLAEVVDSLTQLSDANALLPRERQTLDKARQFLICEISEVLEESRAAVQGQIDSALASKRKLLKLADAECVQSHPVALRENECTRASSESSLEPTPSRSSGISWRRRSFRCCARKKAFRMRLFSLPPSGMRRSPLVSGITRKMRTLTIHIVYLDVLRVLSKVVERLPIVETFDISDSTLQKPAASAA